MKVRCYSLLVAMLTSLLRDQIPLLDLLCRFVVGAHSIAIQSFEARAILAGAPARPIGNVAQ